MSGAWIRPRLVPAASTTSHRDDLHAPIITFTLALGDDAFELRQGQVHHAPIARAHRLEGDDLPVAHGLLAQPARHAGERVLTPAAVTVRVHADVATLDAGAVHGAVHDELERREHLALLADDAPGIRPGDDDLDVVALGVWPLQPHGAL